ncbi:MAG: Glu/Leu/Phe/Val family dehydrogenase [Streptosporangiaceae bacterium]
MGEIRASWHADEWGPAQVVFLRLRAGVDAVVVVDNVALGPAIGGVRIRPDIGVGEVARLARAMTLKNALAGLPHGGGKSGIAADPGLAPAEHEMVMRAFARAIEQLTDYTPGPDMGTTETSMAYVRDEIGRAVGLPAVLGGVPLDELGATGFGLAVCADVLAGAGLLELRGARVVVQGFGAVGGHAARLLADRGANVIAASDSRGATWNPAGLDIPALLAHKRSGVPVAGFAGGSPVPREGILGLDCEVLVPAAQPDVITADNAGKISARVILQGANIPATAEAEAELAARGVLCVPDVIANSGGVICAAAEYRGAGRAGAFADITEKVSDATAELLDRIRPGTVTPRAAAEQMAAERLRKAMALRRSF